MAPAIASDTSEHVATIVAAWAVLSQFYPFFRDQDIDWSSHLRDAILDAATARSTADTHLALARLLTKLHDNHARAIHSNFSIDGILPLALRKFGNNLVVTGTLDDYTKEILIGSELISIDGAPALQAYHAMSDRIASATSGWSDIMIPFWMTIGPMGGFSTIRVKAPSGTEVERTVPHLSRKLYDSVVRESRPVFGAELASGIYYVDLEAIKADAWQAVLPRLTHANVVVLDMRGYPSNVAFSVLGHFANREIHSPEWQIPVLESGGYITSHWTVRPLTPHLDAKVLILLDGRTGSAAETVLQMVHDNHLGTLIGETSAGTNGNTITVALPGDFSMRFTGMRVPLADGTVLQGHGIVPDITVHPTLEGVRAGRDEVLDAAIEHAKLLMNNQLAH
jgi:hypothetical protein